MRPSNEIIQKLTTMTKRMRKNIFNMAHSAGAGSSHLGGGLSMVEITATLFGAIMNYDARNPEWSERDRFILSKGHGVLGYYTALAEAGYLTEEDLATFDKSGSDLLGHPIMNRKKGIEFSTGSLGMGLSLGIGVALAGRRRDAKYRVYVLMGDGECNEGSVWEAAMAGAQYKLNRLTAILDHNKLQQTGANQEIMSVGDLRAKWESFGWRTLVVDGHDIASIYDAFTTESSTAEPLAIIANTIKGKGLSFAENNNDWHHAPLSKVQLEQALAELEQTQVVIK